MLIFALLGVNQSKLNSVIQRIRSLGPKHLNKVHLVYGEYDIIAEIKAHNPDTSAELLRSLKETDGVNSLKAYVVSDEITEERDLELANIPADW